MIEAQLSPGRLITGQETDLTVRLTNTDTGTCTNLVFKLVLPNQVLLVRGSERVEVPQLAAGDSHTTVLRVRPNRSGRCTVRSMNFSYRDRFGMARRIVDFQADLEVEPPAPQAPPVRPQLRVELTTTGLPYEEWALLQGKLTNVGEVSLRQVVVTLTGPFRVEVGGGERHLGVIAPGNSVDFACYVCANQRGDIPVHMYVGHVDESGRYLSSKQTNPVNVRRSPGDPKRQAGTDRFTILYLAANPIDTERIRLDKEIREIREVLARRQDQFEVHDRFAVQVRDISQALLDVRPRVVHFSGHSTSDGRLYVENDSGNSSQVPMDGLASFFKLMAAIVDCVIVNACHTDALADAISEHVDYVIGMSEQIRDSSAIAFSIGFYQALAAGRAVEEAFGFGCAQIQAQPTRGEDYTIPRLLRRN